MSRSERRLPDVYEAGSHRDPFQILTGEHAIIRLQLARTADAVRRDAASPEARQLLASFADGFRLHERREDRVLYPECERLFGGRDGVARVLREDHDAMGRTLQQLLNGPSRDEPISSVLLDELGRRLEDHFVKEERVLFPVMTAYLPGRASATLSRRLRAAEIT